MSTFAINTKLEINFFHSELFIKTELINQKLERVNI